MSMIEEVIPDSLMKQIRKLAEREWLMVEQSFRKRRPSRPPLG